MADLDDRFPALEDLRARARKRIPHFVWEYFDSGTGTGAAQSRNRADLDAVLLAPAILKGPVTPDLSCSILGQSFTAPIGIAPVGMSGVIWPDAERLLARLAAQQGIPYCLSTVAAQSPEVIGPIAGARGWFQLYPPTDPDIRRDMLRRAREAGFSALILTVDLAVMSRRERQRRSGLTNPPRITPRLAAQVAMRPAWALAMQPLGLPRMRTLEPYVDMGKGLPSGAHAGTMMRTAPDWEYLAALRDEWDGPLIIKGVLGASDVPRLAQVGVDGIWVSNHAGRQFDAAPSGLSALKAVRAAAGPDMPIIYDGGIESGLDVLRALAHGADFTMLGRAWHYGLGAAGAAGARQVLHILSEDMKACMGQMGIARPEEVRHHLL